MPLWERRRHVCGRVGRHRRFFVTDSGKICRGPGHESCGLEMAVVRSFFGVIWIIGWLGQSFSASSGLGGLHYLLRGNPLHMVRRRTWTFKLSASPLCLRAFEKHSSPTNHTWEVIELTSKIELALLYNLSKQCVRTYDEQTVLQYLNTCV